MEDNQENIKLINDIIKPETDLEKLILSDPDFIEGAIWGFPRPGHPEGKVIYHIGEVLANIDPYHPRREKMRLIAIIHDTFKNKVDTNQSKSGENHHAMIARRFAERFITDTETLDIIELHDEAYNSWQKVNRGKPEKGEQRARALIKRLGLNLLDYLDFYFCDGQTGDKKNDDYRWFTALIKQVEDEQNDENDL